MVLASFRTPGEFGDWRRSRTKRATVDLNLESYARFFTESVYLQVFIKSAGTRR